MERYIVIERYEDKVGTKTNILDVGTLDELLKSKKPILDHGTPLGFTLDSYLYFFKDFENTIKTSEYLLQSLGDDEREGWSAKAIIMPIDLYTEQFKNEIALFEVMNKRTQGQPRYTTG